MQTSRESNARGVQPVLTSRCRRVGTAVAVLRYRVTNPANQNAEVSIAFSVENPVGMELRDVVRRPTGEKRINERLKGPAIEGLFMTSPGLQEGSPLAGSFAVSILNPGEARSRCFADGCGDYAEVEASLAWLNWCWALRLERALPPAAVAGPLLERLNALFT